GPSTRPPSRTTASAGRSPRRSLPARARPLGAPVTRSSRSLLEAGQDPRGGAVEGGDSRRFSPPSRIPLERGPKWQPSSALGRALSVEAQQQVSPARLGLDVATFVDVKSSKII